MRWETNGGKEGETQAVVMYLPRASIASPPLTAVVIVFKPVPSSHAPTVAHHTYISHATAIHRWYSLHNLRMLRCTASGIICSNFGATGIMARRCQSTTCPSFCLM